MQLTSYGDFYDGIGVEVTVSNYELHMNYLVFIVLLISYLYKILTAGSKFSKKTVYKVDSGSTNFSDIRLSRRIKNIYY